MASRKEQKERLRAERLRREAEEQAATRRRRLIQYGSGAGLLAVIVVVVAIVVSQSGSSASGAGAGGKVVDASLVSNQLHGIPQSGTILGDPAAKVTVVEYGDLQCPVCRAFSFDVAPALISQVVAKGTADYEFRQFPILGPDSIPAAKAALAAGEQGRYWNFVELFYRNQGEENSGYVTDSLLTSIAQAAGVRDISKWNSDRQSSKWDAQISKVQSDAQALGFNSTPSFVVEGPGGKKVLGSGVIPLSQIESAIKSVQ
jgi:protein-disulfide isomerase